MRTSDLARQHQHLVPTPPTGKLCTKCRAYLPVEAFAASSRIHSGRQPSCRVCEANRLREYRRNKRTT